jgi:uncharacterized protein (TIGR02246 family)
MAITGPIEDQIAIRNLHDTYADAVFRRDPTDWGALWTEDAQWDLMGTKVDGREAIVTLWNGAMAGFAFVGFFYQTGAIAIDGDSGTGRVYTNEVLHHPDGRIARTVGQYDDHYVRRDGHWLYQRRDFKILKDS